MRKEKIFLIYERNDVLDSSHAKMMLANDDDDDGDGTRAEYLTCSQQPSLQS